MGNLLNFNSNRTVGFDAFRHLQFDVNRELSFNSDRELIFNPSRDLGFGKRGIMFRGFRCENCGAITTSDATECNECGAVFEESGERATARAEQAERARQPRRAWSRTATPAQTTAPIPLAPPAHAPPAYSPPSYRPPPPAARPSPVHAPQPAPSASRFCPNCGARSWTGDAFCWNCGARFTSGSNIVTATPRAEAMTPPEGTEAMKLPPKTAKKVTKDWRETGKSLEEFAEEK